MSFVTAEELTALPREYVDVDVSPWCGEGKTMRLWQLNALDAVKLALSSIGPDKKPDLASMARMRARLLVYTLGDESGRRLYAEGDEEKLEKLHAGLFKVLVDAAERLTDFNASAQSLSALFEQRQQSAQPSR